MSFIDLDMTDCGTFRVGMHGVKSIQTPKDRKTEFIGFEDKTLVKVKSAFDYPAFYPLHEARFEKKAEAVLMDLDGTSVNSEEFWVWVIEKTIKTLMDNHRFELCEGDLPFVSGHSVSEHLQYCINRYCPEKTLTAARAHYFEITRYEMNEIMNGRGNMTAFKPTEGLDDFLYTLKDQGIKIGLVTSGLYEKAMPEIISAFKQLKMGDPYDFYDSIITAGYPLNKGSAGTMGELSPKPHPWLYAEPACLGVNDGNIEATGVEPLLHGKMNPLHKLLSEII